MVGCQSCLGGLGTWWAFSVGYHVLLFRSMTGPISDALKFSYNELKLQMVRS